jgi:transposase
VADSKLCSKENMKYIDENHGKFITVLPGTRSETLWFHEYIQDHKVYWKDAFIRIRSKGDIRFRVFDSPIPSSEGFRIVLVWSSQKAELDSDTRDRSIRRSVSDLEGIESALQRSHMRKERIVKKAEEAIKGVLYIKYEIKEEHVGTFRKSGRGRPSAGSTYRRIENRESGISYIVVHGQECS